MDHSLVSISDYCCTSDACNYSDKTILLLKEQTFCRGIVVTKTLVTIGKHSFTPGVDILLGNELPDTVHMDHSLVTISDNCCTSYACNYSDKIICLLKDQTFCRGIVVANPFVTIGEHSFTASIETTQETIAKEINTTDFPQYESQLIQALRKFRDAIALEGDRLWSTDVLQHNIVLEDDAKPFLYQILSYLSA